MNEIEIDMKTKSKNNTKSKAINNEEKKPSKIGNRNVLSILLLGTAGQVAWAVENSWFNTFVYDRITTDPAPIAWMVAVSAIVATLTTLIMGTASDRTATKWGKRKPYIVFGYVLWGIITAIYPLVEWIKNVGVAVVMIVITDAVMTFFGSTANDAAFNAWLADIGDAGNRNRIDSISKVTVFLAQIIALGAAGIIIDQYGYFTFFYILGGFVTITGLVAALLIKSTPVKTSEVKREKSLRKEIGELLNPNLLKKNRILFLLFLNMMIGGIATQVYMPYLFTFIEHYVGFDKTTMSLYFGGFMLLLVVFMVGFGFVSHKYNRKTIIIFGTLVGGAFTVGVGLFSEFLTLKGGTRIAVFVIFFLGYMAIMAAQIAHGGWLLDSYPKGDVGKFQGVRMIFMILIPMVIGPAIGAQIIRAFGTPTVDGFIPTPEIFLVGGIISFFGIIPIALIDKKKGKVTLD